MTTNSSFKAEFLVSGTWAGNAVRLPTELQAQRYASALFARWTTPTDFRVVPSDKAVNYHADERGGLVPLAEGVSIAEGGEA